MADLPDFVSVVGQHRAKSRLQSLLTSLNNHFIIFSGPIGQGKKTSARAFASAILAAYHHTADELAQIQLDDQSSFPTTADQRGLAVRRLFEARTHPDYRELLQPAPGKMIPVDSVREVVADVEMLPQLGRYKVYLLEGDGLNEAGQNALLKTLEEPPGYAIFLLTVSGQNRLLETVSSRGVEIHLTRNNDEEIEIILERVIAAREDVRSDIPMKLLTRFADGCPGRAIELATSEWFLPVRQDLFELVQLLLSASPASVLAAGWELFET
ncbi:MAG TPA: hypothetical protein GX717_06750, partial [Clostridiaceae bacterium]|nr:hypothetical protein [Clostridiaceae bacterium]